MTMYGEFIDIIMSNQYIHHLGLNCLAIT